MEFVKSCQYECTTIGAGHLKQIWFFVTLKDGSQTRIALTPCGDWCNASENFFYLDDDIRDEVQNIAIDMLEEYSL